MLSVYGVLEVAMVTIIVGFFLFGKRQAKSLSAATRSRP
jgi:hypothetical protein